MRGVGEWEVEGQWWATSPEAAADYSARAQELITQSPHKQGLAPWTSHALKGIALEGIALAFLSHESNVRDPAL